jgi:hypothetical protein
VGPKNRKIGQLKSHYSQYSDEDLQQEAKLGAWAYWTSIKAEIAQEIPVPQAPVSLPTERNALWGTVNPILAKAEAKVWADSLLPILRGHWDKLPEKAHQSLKNLWEKQKAQKRDGIEWPYQEERFTEGAYTGTETMFFETEEAKKIVREWIAQENQKERLEQIKRAAKQLGDKAAEVFEHRIKVETDKEAAELAGITERTYRNYRDEVRQILNER